MKKVLVLYHSQEFGNTAEMAKAVAAGLEGGGCSVDLFNTNDGRFDLTKFPQYDGVAIGSPNYYNYIAGGLKVFMDDFYIYNVRKNLKGLRGKPFILFYTHGGGDRIKDVMPKLFRYIGNQIGEAVGCMNRPDEEVLSKCKSLAEKLAEAIP